MLLKIVVDLYTKTNLCDVIINEEPVLQLYIMETLKLR
jgi:hypothetical protein